MLGRSLFFQDGTSYSGVGCDYQLKVLVFICGYLICQPTPLSGLLPLVPLRSCPASYLPSPSPSLPAGYHPVHHHRSAGGTLLAAGGAERHTAGSAQHTGPALLHDHVSLLPLPLRRPAHLPGGECWGWRGARGTPACMHTPVYPPTQTSDAIPGVAVPPPRPLPLGGCEGGLFFPTRRQALRHISPPLPSPPHRCHPGSTCPPCRSTRTCSKSGPQGCTAYQPSTLPASSQTSPWTLPYPRVRVWPGESCVRHAFRP